MKKVLLTLLTIMVTMAVNAEKVSKQEALQKALQFMPDKQFRETKAFVRGDRDESNSPFYVFNVESDGGYVIVSGDDRTREILGYSEHGNLEEDKMPDNMKWWFDNIARQIKAIGTTLKPAAKLVTSNDMKAISPLIQTEWGQEAPFNSMCPDGNHIDFDEPAYDANNRCPTGCVATAMAQVMYYWQWPKTCLTLDGYTIGKFDEERNFIPLYSLKALPSTTFKWDKMKKTYNSDETGESVDAVAELMHYCGRSVHLAYSIDGTGGGVDAIDMARTFNYSFNIRRVGRGDYTTKQWENIIYEELASGRPVLYDGDQSPNEEGLTIGHKFIVDGYDGDGLFHINWGWGYGGSYYVLSVADPEADQGADSSVHYYQFNQSALIGVKPSVSSEILLPEMKSYIINENRIINKNNKNNDLNDGPALKKDYYRINETVDFSDVTLCGLIFTSYLIDPSSELKTEIGWALYQNDQYLQLLGSESATIPLEKDHAIENLMNVSFGAGLPDGKYQICQVYRFEGENEWIRCAKYGSQCIIAEIDGNTLIVRMSNLRISKFKVNSVSITPDLPEEKRKIEFKANITNEGENRNIIGFLWTQKQGTETFINVSSFSYDFGRGQSGDIYFNYIPEEAGTYILKITSNRSEDDVLWTGSITVGRIEEIILDDIKYLCSFAYRRAKVIRNENVQETLTTAIIMPTVTVDGVTCRVTEIDDNAFGWCHNLTTLSMPSGIESIGKYAFAQTCISEIKLPPKLKIIGEGAFYGCHEINSIEIPEGVEKIGNSAFRECWSLDNLELPSSLTSIGETIVGGGLSSVVSHITDPKKVMIHEDAFVGYSWNSTTQQSEKLPSSAILYVPLGKKSLYESIPAWTMFSKIEEGEPMEAMDGGLRYSYSTGGSEATVIQDDSYKDYVSVVIPTTVTFDHKQYKVTAIDNNTFCGCKNLSKVTFPEGIVSIGDQAFQGCDQLSDVTFPEGLVSIGDRAFLECNKLGDVSIPEGVEVIGDDAFSYIFNLSKLVLPSSLKSLGNHIVRYDKDLTSVVSRLTEPFVIDNDVFAYSIWWIPDAQQYEKTPSSATLYVPIGSKSLYDAAGWTTQFAKVEEGEPQETKVGVLRYAYATGGSEATVIQDESYKELAEVTIPATVTLGGKSYMVTAVGNSAFRECRNLTSVTLPDGLVSIGKYSFYNTGIKGIAFPKTLKSIGEGAFWNCWQITIVKLPDNLEYVGPNAFCYISNLQKVVLPSTIQSIGDGAFFYNQNLTLVESHITEPFDISESVFAGSSTWDDMNYISIYSPSSAKLYVPAGTKSKYAAVKGWNMFAGIEEVEPSALSGDANGSGDVNAADIDAVVDYIMKTDMNGFIFKNADVNGDKKINATDIVLINNIIWGRFVNKK